MSNSTSPCKEMLNSRVINTYSSLGEKLSTVSMVTCMHLLLATMLRKFWLVKMEKRISKNTSVTIILKVALMAHQ